VEKPPVGLEYYANSLISDSASVTASRSITGSIINNPLLDSLLPRSPSSSYTTWARLDWAACNLDESL
jgi:hypothetical protein